MWFRACLCLLLSLPLQAAEVWKGQPADVPDLRRRAAQGEAAALADLAFLSRYGRDGVAWDAAMIFDDSKRSAEAGDAFGMANLSYCFMNGCGTAFDAEQAYDWAKKSADLGHPSGIVRLAICNLRGWGTPKDHEQSFQLAEQGATAGALQAKVLTAFHHGSGKGTQRNRALAIRISHELVRDFNWYPAAPPPLKVIEGMEDPGRFEAARADFHRCIAEHMNLGLPRAEYQYAKFNRHRISDEEALSLLISAARKGHRRASVFLWRCLNTKPQKVLEFPLYGSDDIVFELSRASYEAGTRIDEGHASHAVRSYLRRSMEGPENLSEALAICQDWISKGHHRFHRHVAAVYHFGVIDEIAEYARPDLVEAHVIYCQKPEDPFLIRCLVHAYLSMDPLNGEDLARGYLTARRWLDLGSDDGEREESLARFEDKMLEKDHKLVRKLEKERFPTGKRFVKEARERILASGFQLPPEGTPTK